MPSDKDISKFLSLVLRHAPEKIGLTLGPQGWVPVAELLSRMNRAGQPVTQDALFRIVAESDKQRFTLSEDRTQIRAAQGHSVKVDLGLTPAEPPPKLFHGTADKNLDAILREGLRPGKRMQVHLSADHATAVNVGQRHGRPVVLDVDCTAMRAAGHLFYRADNGVWLTDSVAPEYLALRQKE